MSSAENSTNLSIFRKSICLHSYVPYSVRELIYNRAMKKENKGAEPKKVGYLKYLRLYREEVKPTEDMLYRLDDELAFMKKYQPSGFLYFLYCLPQRISNRIDRYKIEHLKLGKQKWRNGKLYIERIPYFVSSEATMCLTAILRDYLRAYIKDACAVGNVVYGADDNDTVSYFELVENYEGDALEDWRKMVSDTADLFDEAADLCKAVWDTEKWEDMDRLWKEYRAKLAEAFDHLKVIFHELDD